MSEFFKQLIAQTAVIWGKLSLQQKIITSSVVALAFFGLITLMLWSGGNKPATAGYTVLYSNLEVTESSEITDVLKESNYKYKIENDGRNVLVEKKSLYEARMALARKGLPKHRGLGYELFDKNNLGMTDFVQKLNARRALEGEMQRTIEGLEEVEAARVHLVIPEPSIFLENQKNPTASVVVKTKGGTKLGKEQIRGIGYLVSSSVEGLKPDNISIVDDEGRLLSNPYGNDESALVSSRNIELQQNVERYLENKVDRLLSNVLGQGKSAVQVAVDLDFDKVEKTLEQYNPESRVVRSEERNDENVKNAPDGDRQKERSLTNYEIDKTVQSIVGELGNIKRMTISVAVDGRYAKPDSKDKKAEPAYEARTAVEIQNIEEMVKNATGYDLARGDQISVANVKFDNEQFKTQLDGMNMEMWMKYGLMGIKYVGIFVIILALILFLRSLAKTLAEAMNPPVPEVKIAGVADEQPVEVPANVRKTNEILERVEMMTKEEPINITSIIRQWLNEGASTKRKKEA
jgi:flagellar M-ring protein FliF